MIASDNQGCGDSFPMVERLPLGPCYGFPGVTAFCNDAVFSKTGSNFAALGPVIDQSNAGTLTGRGGLFSTSNSAPRRLSKLASYAPCHRRRRWRGPR